MFTALMMTYILGVEFIHNLKAGGDDQLLIYGAEILLCRPWRLNGIQFEIIINVLVSTSNQVRSKRPGCQDDRLR